MSGVAASDVAASIGESRAMQPRSSWPGLMVPATVAADEKILRSSAKGLKSTLSSKTWKRNRTVIR